MRKINDEVFVKIEFIWSYYVLTLYLEKNEKISLCAVILLRTFFREESKDFCLKIANFVAKDVAHLKALILALLNDDCKLRAISVIEAMKR